MTGREAAGRWLRPGIAAAVGCIGVLLPGNYAAVTCGAYQGLYGTSCAIFDLLLLVVCLIVAGLLGAALVRGWEGAALLLAGTFAGCVLAGVSVLALGRPVDPAGLVPLFCLCSVPLLGGYSVGRGLAGLR